MTLISGGAHVTNAAATAGLQPPKMGEIAGVRGLESRDNSCAASSPPLIGN